MTRDEALAAARKFLPNARLEEIQPYTEKQLARMAAREAAGRPKFGPQERFRIGEIEAGPGFGLYIIHGAGQSWEEALSKAEKSVAEQKKMLADFEARKAKKRG